MEAGPNEVWVLGRKREGRRGYLISKKNAECSCALDNGSFLVPSLIPYHSLRHRVCNFAV